jgi:hypothetical protein
MCRCEKFTKITFQELRQDGHILNKILPAEGQSLKKLRHQYPCYPVVKKTRFWRDIIPYIFLNNFFYSFLGIIVAIPCQTSYVDLGVTVISNLSFELHINNMVSRARQRILYQYFVSWFSNTQSVYYATVIYHIFTSYT